MLRGTESETISSGGPAKIVSIQVLRAVAVLVVILFHGDGTAASYFKESYTRTRAFEFGHYGVDIFFVISGFIIAYMLLDRKQSRRDFAINRIARIIPPYYALTFLFVALLFLVPGVFRSATFTVPSLLLSLTFLSEPLTGSLPLLYVGWTLTYELFFYLIMFIIHPWFVRHFRGTVIVATLLFAAGCAVAGDDHFEVLYLGQFLLGALILGRWRSLLSLSSTAGLSAVILGSLWWFDHLQLFYGAVAGAVLLSIFLIAERWRPALFGSKLLVDLGNASYAAYLLQFFTIPALAKLMSLFRIPYIEIVYLSLMIVVTLVAAHFFYRIAEKRLTAWTRAALQRVFV